MTTFKSLLAATDFSADGNNAVRRAALLARDHGAKLHVMHALNAAGFKPLRDWFSPAVDIGLKAAQARHSLQQVAAEITRDYGVKATVEVALGDPYHMLLGASGQFDLGVIGRRGQSLFSGLLAGRTTDRLLRNCQRPILAVRTPAEHPYRSVLVPIDFSALSDVAIQAAAHIRREASMQVLHAVSSRHDAALRDADIPEHIIKETRMMEEAETKARMRRQAAYLGLDCAPLSFALVNGPAVRSTLRHARQHQADLIVAGKQGQSILGSILRRSVNGRNLSRAACDILIVPKPRDRAPSQVVVSVAPRLSSEVHLDNTAMDHNVAVNAGASTQGSWIHNTARFVSRRPS